MNLKIEIRKSILRLFKSLEIIFIWHITKDCKDSFDKYLRKEIVNFVLVYLFNQSSSGEARTLLINFSDVILIDNQNARWNVIIN